MEMDITMAPIPHPPFMSMFPTSYYPFVFVRYGMIMK